MIVITYNLLRRLLDLHFRRTSSGMSITLCLTPKVRVRDSMVTDQERRHDVTEVLFLV